MHTLTKTASALAAAGLLVAGIAAGAASAKTGPGGSVALNVPDGKTSTVATAAAATVPQRVFAVVNPDGTKLRGKAVASTAHLSPGVYDVRFNRNLSTCAWTGTVGFGTFGGSTAASMISISGRAGTNNGLFVQTFNSAGTPTDLPFSAIAICS